MKADLSEKYELTELLYQSSRSTVSRGWRVDDHMPVIVKRLRTTATAVDCALTRYAHDLLHDLEIDGVPSVLDLASDEDRPALVMKDVGGRSVDQILHVRSFSPADMLRVAISLARILGHLHQRDIIHQDVRPSNVVLNESTGEVELIDYQRAARLTIDAPSRSELETYRGSYAFIAPELTGRTNHAIDHRSDLYSFGATLFYLLTRRPPFDDATAASMVYSHVAAPAPAPHDINPNVPEMLSRVVLRLLSKSPAERYQSAHGAEADLRTCLEQLDGAGDASTFALGRHDVSSRFLTPEKLYGRTGEVEALIRSVEETEMHRTGLVLVSGPPGIGKSRLVATVRAHIERKGGTFLEAKFDQLQNVPLTALLQCLQEFVDGVLAEPDEELKRWQREMSAALGSVGRVLVEHVPALEKIIGPQAVLPEVAPSEAFNRLLLAIVAVLRVICARRGRVVIFLDDLQWSGLNSIRLLEHILTNGEIRGLLVIGAYRSTDVDESHPVRLLPQHLTTADVPVAELAIGPLSTDAVQELVADTLVTGAAEASALARLVYARTGGDPFYVKRFLRAAYGAGAIAFDADIGQWRVDVDRVTRIEPTDTVAQLISDRLNRLPAATQETLNLAACIGGRFTLAALARFGDTSVAETARMLWPALSEDVLIPVAGQWRIAEHLTEGDAPSQDIVYRFSHDSVRLAAYELFPPDRREQRHVRIGWITIAGADERHPGFLEGVNQLNAGRNALGKHDERMQLCELNLRAAMRARNVAAFSDGVSYVQRGLQLLPRDSWTARPSLTLQLHLVGAELAYLVSDFEEMERLSAAAAHVPEREAIAEFARIRVVAALSRGEPSKAVDRALEGLAALGIPLPRKPGKLYLLWELLRTRLALRRHHEIDLLSERVATNIDILAPLKVLGEVCRASYTAQPELFLLFILRMVRLGVRDGITPTSSIALAHYALLLIIIFGDTRGARRFGDLALRLAEHPVCLRYKPQTRFVVLDFLQHWQLPLRTVIEPIYGVFQEAREVGDLETAAVAPVVGINAMSISGVPLAEIAERAARYVDAVRNQQTYFYMLELARQRVLNLMGRAAGDPLLLKGETAFDETAILPTLEAERVGTTLCGYHMIKSRLAYLLQRYDVARHHADLTLPLLPTLAGSYQELLFQYYDALAFVQHVPDRGIARYRTLRRIRQRLARLRRAARRAPMNFGHLADIVVAELAAATGRELDATNGYDRAIAASHANGFLEDEAVAMELAGRFHLRRARAEIGRGFLRESYALFARLGAAAKLHVLAAEFPWLATFASAPTVPGIHASQLDVGTLIKASQAISGEIVLTKLVDTLMSTVVESAGADHAVLFLHEDNGLEVAARFAAGAGLQIGGRERANNAAGFASSVVRYVERTGKAVVIGDTSVWNRFAEDPHLARGSARSMLCVPLVLSNRNLGVVYLENSVSTEAFPPDRVALLRALSGQMAISLDNARLYEKLQHSLHLQTQLTTAQTRFIPAEFLQVLGRTNIADVGLGDHREKEMSILFSDIRDFTTLLEQMTPAQSIDFLNTYLGRMEPVIIQQGGFIDSYIGDGIMALFDAHPDQAVSAALGMHRALRTLNEERLRRGEGAVRTGIGIHTGAVMLGTIGGRNHLRCGVIGDAVNLASRVEGLTKQYGVSLLITESTRDRLNPSLQRRTRIVSRVRVAGRQTPVNIFEVLDAIDIWAADALEHLELFERAATDFYEAKTASELLSCVALFERYATFVPADPLPGAYVARCRRRLHDDAPGWDGTELAMK